MRHFICIRSAYGPAWSLEANRRRLALTEGVTLRSLRSQTERSFTLVVLLHAADPLRQERMRAFAQFPATFLWTDDDRAPADVAFGAYRADWAAAIGPRDEAVVMTRLDDDDAFAPWAMALVSEEARKVRARTALVFPLGIRVWQGGYSLVRHVSNAMHTLVTPPGEGMTVYDYGHRKVRKIAPVRLIGRRPAWLWARHPDTISGWRISSMALDDYARRQFDVDWRLFGEPRKQPKAANAGFAFR